MQSTTASTPFLGPEEPSPFEILREGERRVVLTCDHASHAIPERLGSLGVSQRYLRSHIAWDIGAASVTRGALPAARRRTAVLGGYSRLVVDLNRSLGDASAFPPISDGILVAGNVGLGSAAKAERATRALHRPITTPSARCSRRMLDAASGSPC